MISNTLLFEQIRQNSANASFYTIKIKRKNHQNGASEQFCSMNTKFYKFTKNQQIQVCHEFNLLNIFYSCT